MLKRKIMELLLAWKEDPQKIALNIVGARQVGKSTVVREFGRKEYEVFIEINFINQPGAAAIFEGISGAQALIEGITAYTGTEIIPGNTLILLDEIQECPAARTAIKFLVEDGRADYIETGSLLGVKISEIKSYPVGFERIVHMYPMDFEEFCWANNVQISILESLQKNYEQRSPVLPAVHEAMLSLFNTWIAVGGMPRVVQEYVLSHDMATVSRLQQDIIDLYQNDISQYAEKSKRLEIQDIFHAIPAQLDDKNRRFYFSAVRRNGKYREMSASFLWLCAAGVALPCFNTDHPQPPLELNRKRNLFKLFLGDTGLLCRMSHGNIQFSILRGDVAVNAGSILENAFAQALVSKNLELFYYDAKRLELDFIVQNQFGLDIFEIKSGNDYHQHASLDKALEHPEWDFNQCIVFCKGNIEQTDSILYLPFYMIMFYQKPVKKNPDIWIPDLRALIG